MKSAKWSSSDGVQLRILDAALSAFKERGYTACKLTDVVQAAGVSVGSIYHHFGGKEDLFNACHTRLRDEIRESIGVDPDKDVPKPGTWEQHYLRAVRMHRESCSVFLGTDTPPGFDAGVNGAYYYPDVDRHTARMLSAILLEASRIVCGDDDDDGEAERVIESTVQILRVVQAIGF